MSGAGLDRRELLSVAAASIVASAFGARVLRAETTGRSLARIPPQLDAFISRYMQAMDAPGLILALANRERTLGTAAYGYVDLAAKVPVEERQLFEIGSITKSFAALVLLQLQDERKLDVQHPILKYLPWLPIETDYGDIRIHHLLTHSSGMP
ncbi:MAG TPA: serine hydrolase domain-containing protein, partial [Steroidobacteraceae bacterium]|nr:serine hydrolase domain-containing protein [Steroidobacteraceae bacterium]